METAQGILDLAKSGQELGVVGILFAVIGLLLVALYFLIRHYIAQFKATEGRCEKCEKKVKQLEMRCHDLEIAIADIVASRDMDEARAKAARTTERLRA